MQRDTALGEGMKLFVLLTPFSCTRVWWVLEEKLFCCPSFKHPLPELEWREWKKLPLFQSWSDRTAKLQLEQTLPERIRACWKGRITPLWKQCKWLLKSFFPLRETSNWKLNYILKEKLKTSFNKYQLRTAFWILFNNIKKNHVAGILLLHKNNQNSW